MYSELYFFFCTCSEKKRADIYYEKVHFVCFNVGNVHNICVCSVYNNVYFYSFDLNIHKNV